MANDDEIWKQVGEKLKKVKVDTLSKYEELSNDGVMDLRRKFTNALYGFNEQKINIIPEDLKLNSGYTFFTRPMLDLRDKNIRNNRAMSDLMDTGEKSINRYIRCTLDPRLMYKPSLGIKSLLMDNKQCFIPLLTNTLKNISGGQDRAVPIFASKEGVRKEQYIMVDGTHEMNSAYEINVTFKAFAGNIVAKLFRYWCMSSTYYFEGMMDTYNDLKLAGELGYTTRIYRLVMDSTLTRVESIMYTGYSIPMSFPDGQLWDYNSEIPFSESTKEVQIVFKSSGFEVDDPMAIAQFNEHTAITNPDYARMVDGLDSGLVRVPKSLLGLYRFRTYPYINPDTRELEWYIPKSIILPAE